MFAKFILLATALCFVAAISRPDRILEEEHARIEEKIFKLISQHNELSYGATKRFRFSGILSRLARYWNDGVDWFNTVWDKGVEHWNRMDQWMHENLDDYGFWTQLKESAVKLFHEHADDLLEKAMGLVETCDDQIESIKQQDWYKNMHLTADQIESPSMTRLIMAEALTHAKGITTAIANKAVMSCQAFKAVLTGDHSVDFLSVLKKVKKALGTKFKIEKDASAAAKRDLTLVRKRGLFKRFKDAWAKLRGHFSEVMDSVSDFYSKGVEKWAQMKAKIDEWAGPGTVDKFIKTLSGHIEKKGYLVKFGKQFAAAIAGCPDVASKIENSAWVKGVAHKALGVSEDHVGASMMQNIMEMVAIDSAKNMALDAMDRVVDTCQHTMEWLNNAEHSDYKALGDRFHKFFMKRADRDAAAAAA